MKWLFAFVLLFVVLLGGVAAAPSFFDWNQYKVPALKQVRELTGHDVRVAGDVSLALLPSPRVYLKDVSVVDPQDASGQKQLASFELLDVRVGLLPLLKGQAVVQSINLKKPVIALSKDDEGQFNFMTPELEALMAAKDAVQGAAEQDQEGMALDVSFENIQIFEGSFTLREAGKTSALSLSGIDLDVKASSLAGPFKAEGQMNYNGRLLRFDAKTGLVDQGLQSSSLNANVDFEGLNAKYAGVFTFGDAPEVQGEVSLSLPSITGFLGNDTAQIPDGLSGAVSAQGILSANAQGVALKNAELKIGGKNLAGSFEAQLKPLVVQADFRGEEIIDLDALVGEGSGGKQAFDPLAIAAALPETLELPALENISVSINVPGVIFNGQVLKNVSFQTQTSDKSFVGVLSAGEIPGQGQLEVQGALSFSEKSKSAKSGVEIYSDPTAVIEVKGQSRNVALTVQAFSGLSDLPLIRGRKNGVFDIQAKVTPFAFSLDKAVVNIDDMAVSASGSVTRQSGSERSLMKAKVVIDRLDFDSFSGGAGRGSVRGSGGDRLQPLQTFSLPFDLDVEATVHSAVMQGHEIEGLKIAAAFLPNSIQFKNVGADRFAGSSVSLSGGISDLKAFSGLQVKASVDTPDPYKLAQAFKVDTKSWPQGLGRTVFEFDATGAVNALAVNTNVKAMGGQVSVQGFVDDALTQLSFSDLSVHFEHPNMNEAIQNFAKGAPHFMSLSKALDFKSSVSMDGKVISLSDIQADLAGASLNGSLTFDGSQAKPFISGALNVGDLVLQSEEGGKRGSSGELGSAGGSSGAGGKWSSEKMDTGWLHYMNARFDISANSIVYETWDLSAPSLKLTLQDGVLNIQDLKAGLYDGQISSAGSLSSSGEGQPLSVKMSSDITNINIGSLAKALAGSGRIQGEGEVSLDFDVSGSGGSQNELVSSLVGSAKLSGSRIVMKGFDMAGLAGALMESSKPLARIQQIIGTSTSGGQTAFDTLNGEYAIERGVVNISAMSMDGPEAGIVSTGNVSMPRWYIDTRHEITLKNANEVAPFDVEIQGSLDNPSNTFGSGLFDTFVKSRLSEKLPDILGDGVAEKLEIFGVLPQKRQAPDPGQSQPTVGGAEAPANDNLVPARQQQQEVKPEEAIEGLLRGLLQ